MTGATPARIDAHHHVWDVARRDYPWLDDPACAPIRRTFGLDDLTPLLERNEVAQTVVVQAVDVAEETVDLLETADGPGAVAGVVGWVDLTKGDVGDRIATLRAGTGGGRLVGLRHGVQGEPDPDWLCRPEVGRGLAAVRDAGLDYDLLTLPGQLPAAVRTVIDQPDLRFVLDHLSKPPIAAGDREPWETRIRALAARDNVVCKLSGMVTEADRDAWTVDDLRPYADVVLDAFGPDRLMFGSDWPVCTLAAPYDRVMAAAEELTGQLSETERAAVFGDTARRVYGLA
jgi:L-fuconolactonase